MPFELAQKTKVRCLDVRTLAAKDRRPDEPPGAQLLIQAVLPVETLAMFDGFLPGVLYRKAGTSGPQGKLDGMEGSELTSIGEHIKRMPWDYEQTGCTVEIDRGLGGKRNTPYAGRWVTITVRPDVLDKGREALAAFKAQPSGDPLESREFEEWLNSYRDLPVHEVFHEVVERFRAAYEAGLAARIPAGWQPIETANTHHPILLWWKHCHWPHIGRWVADERGEGWMCDGDQVMPRNQEDCTHWMNLPAPPITATEAPATAKGGES